MAGRQKTAGSGGRLTVISGAALPERDTHVPVEPGFWVMIFGDLTVFAALFGAFVVRRHESDATFQAFLEGSRALNQGIGLANTIVLLTSSMCVARAVVLYRNGAVVQARKQVGLGLALGLTFVALKLVEYSQKIGEGYGVSSSRFFEFYFPFTGLHLMHVVLGIGLLGFVLNRCRDEATTDMAIIEGVGCYWHLVDMLWLMLFALFYLVP